MSAYNQDVGVSVDSASFRSRLASKQLTQRYEESSMASQENQFLKAYQHNPNANNSFAFPTPEKSNYRTINVSKLTQRQALSPSPTNKKSIIEDLTQKNEMLQKEVERVDKILSLGQRRKTKRLPELDGKVVKKQLENAYKQIKIYENDIEQRKKYYEHQGVFVDIIRKTEANLLERQDLVKKLQAEISELKKQSNEFVKLLQDGHIKKQYTNKSSRLHKQIKFFQKQMQEEEELTLSDYYNGQQKNKRIFEMQQELIKSGFDQKELANIKNRLDRREKNDFSMNTTTKKDEEKGEDRSKKAFNDLKAEINLMKKMQKDYAKKIEELQQEKQQAEYKSQQSKKRLEQTQKEIIRLQEMFQEMKRNIDPNKLKPLYKNGTLTESSITQFGTGKGNPLQHQFTTDELGQYNKKHTVVNDRPIIGKKSAYIVQMTLFQNRTQFLGFQAGYLSGQTFIKGNVNVLRRQNERFLKDKTMKLEPGDYFKFFEVCFSKDNVVVGFLAMSKNEKIIKVGPQQGNKREFFFRKKQYPCCFYGSYSNEGFEMLGVEKAESE